MFYVILYFYLALAKAMVYFWLLVFCIFYDWPPGNIAYLKIILIPLSAFEAASNIVKAGRLYEKRKQVERDDQKSKGLGVR